jgi:hypothetical protein
MEFTSHSKDDIMRPRRPTDDGLTEDRTVSVHSPLSGF